MDNQSPRITVLFVGETAEQFALIEKQFQSRYQLLTAKTGEEALALLKVDPIQVVITRLQLSDMSSIDLMERAHCLYPKLAFILVAGKMKSALALQALQLGAHGFLRIPYALSELELMLIEEEKRWALTQEKLLETRQDHLCDQYLVEISTLRYQIPNSIQLVNPLSLRLIHILEGMNLTSPENSHNFLLAINEMLANAIEHGNLEISGEEKYQLKEQGSEFYNAELIRRSQIAPYCNRMVTVWFNATAEKATITIEDEGTGFDHQNLADPTLSEQLFLQSGRGVWLTKMFVDELTYEKNGSRVTLTKYRNATE